ncbi:metallophosphoesterase family protein [Thermodesulfovibrio hydrogeniphilus]
MHSEVIYKPELISNFEPETIIDTFKQTAEVLSKEPPLINLSANSGEAIFVGDTHGDFTLTKYIAKKFLTNEKSYLIFLGDYIDREPEPEGSLYNLLYVCLLKINFSDRVFILKGNHEAHYAVFCYPYEFDSNLIDIFGTFGRDIHSAAIEVFKEMPLMIKTTNGVVASHAGFPLQGQQINEKSRRDLILDILWADAEISPMFRGIGIPRFKEDDLEEFLKKIDAKCLIRGHDPYLANKIIYSNKCLTVFTSRTYASRAGVKIAKVKLSKQIRDARDVVLEDITSLYASE